MSQSIQKEAFTVNGKVEAVLISNTFGTHISTSVRHIDVLIREGIRGDSHAGRRLADAREKELLGLGLPKRIEIANFREFSAVSIEEMEQIAKAMDIPEIPQGILGENLVISGIPSLTLLPPGTLLFFKKQATIKPAILIVSGENLPCIAPGMAIQDRYPDKAGLASLFVKSAMNKRGVVGSVYCSGVIDVGDTVIAKIPQQRIYDPNQ